MIPRPNSSYWLTLGEMREHDSEEDPEGIKAERREYWRWYFAGQALTHPAVSDIAYAVLMADALIKELEKEGE